jgi:hypothetical protein
MSSRLSTSQALKEWNSALQVLLDIKAHVVAHPNKLMPQHLAARLMHSSTAASSMSLASPADTWRQLLQQQVIT